MTRVQPAAPAQGRLAWLAGDRLVLGPDSFLARNGDSLLRVDLEAVLGVTLSAYHNQVDPQAALWRVSWEGGQAPAWPWAGEASLALVFLGEGRLAGRISWRWREAPGAGEQVEGQDVEASWQGAGAAVGLAGLWRLAAATLVEASLFDPRLGPQAGALCRLTSREVVAIDRVPVSREALEKTFGVALDRYENRVDAQAVHLLAETGPGGEAAGLKVRCSGQAIDPRVLLLSLRLDWRPAAGAPPVYALYALHLARDLAPARLAGAPLGGIGQAE